MALFRGRRVDGHTLCRRFRKHIPEPGKKMEAILVEKIGAEGSR